MADYWPESGWPGGGWNHMYSSPPEPQVQVCKMWVMVMLNSAQIRALIKCYSKHACMAQDILMYQHANMHIQ